MAQRKVADDYARDAPSIRYVVREWHDRSLPQETHLLCAGDVVRIAPGELSFATPQSFQDIYGHAGKTKKTFIKAPWYDCKTTTSPSHSPTSRLTMRESKLPHTTILESSVCETPTSIPLKGSLSRTLSVRKR